MFKEFLERITPPDDDFQEDDFFPEQSESDSEEGTRILIMLTIDVALR